MQILGLGLVLTVAAVGCKKKQVGVTPLHGGPGGPGGTVGDVNPDNGLKIDNGTNPDNKGLSSEDIAKGLGQQNTHSGWDKNPDMFKADTVHFDYDSTVIKSGEKSKVAHVADYLKSNTGAAVEIDGHCDERGTDEYNRALGERRALALREEMARLGVDPSRVDTVSFGRDKPVDTGHSDASHAKNRRGEFVLLTPPAGK